MRAALAIPALALVLLASPSFAAEEVAAVYDRGKAAYDTGDYRSAARDFAAADAIVPNAKVLELAIASAAKAEDFVLGMTLVERAESRGLEELAAAGRKMFAGKVGRVEVDCPGAKRCTATLDGAPVVPREPVWATTGEHLIELDSDGTVERLIVNVTAYSTSSVRPTRVIGLNVPEPVTPSARAPIDLTPPAPAKGISRTWFYAAAGVTVAAGIATTVSGIAVLDAHEDFRRNPTASAAEDGRAAELRTNVLLATTGLFAVGTTVLGLCCVRWRTTPQGGMAYVF